MSFVFIFQVLYLANIPQRLSQRKKMVTKLNSSLVFNKNVLSVHVYFPGNKISDDAAKYFAAALLDNSRLGDLNLSHNELSDGAGQFLGHAIGKGNGGSRISQTGGTNLWVWGKYS